MRSSRGVSTFVATLVLVSVSLSLSYVVYEGVSRLSPPRQVVFANQLTLLTGTPDLTRVTVNSSAPIIPLALTAGVTSSSSGILFFDGSNYGAGEQLCSAGTTTFFSVYTGSGILQLQGNGRSWIDGYWVHSLSVQAGWHEVMFSGASSCSVIETDGITLSYPGSDISSVPLIGTVPSANLSFYVPSGGAPSQLLLVYQGGYDQLA